MPLIAPSIFFERFPEGQTVVFVGNAPSLKGEGVGAWIDSFDVVVRFNECPTQGFEADVGARTDILVTNPYFEPECPISLSERGVVILISSQTRRPLTQKLKAALGDTPVLFTFSPDIVSVGNVDHKNGLTTGVYGVHLLSRLLVPAQVGICGFTMFLKETSHHYWQKITPKGLAAHDMSIEAQIFMRICNKIRCPITVTEEIAWVGRQVDIKLRSKEAVIKLLSSSKWKEEEKRSFLHSFKRRKA